MKNRWQVAAAYVFAVLTVTAGILSLLVFGRFLSQTELGARTLGLSDSAALAWDALLCLMFFVQHSGMVRRSFRRWTERRIPAHLHGLIYTLASAAALVLLCVLWQPTEPILPAWSPAVRATLAALSVLALLCFGWAFASLGALDLFGAGALLAQVRGREPAKPRLTIKGPYRWVRHPFYFLAIVLIWASPFVSKDRLLLNVLFTIWIVLGARWEERDLVAAFGDSYRLHQRQAPMLIPWRFSRSPLPSPRAARPLATAPQARPGRKRRASAWPGGSSR